MKDFKSRMYLIYELRDSLPEGIQKNKKLLALEKEFMKIIENSGKKAKFEFMTKDFENQMIGLERSIKNMEKRIPLVQELIEMYEKQDADAKLVEYVLSVFIDAAGVAPEEHIPQPDFKD